MSAETMANVRAVALLLAAIIGLIAAVIAQHQVLLRAIELTRISASRRKVELVLGMIGAVVGFILQLLILLIISGGDSTLDGPTASRIAVAIAIGSLVPLLAGSMAVLALANRRAKGEAAGPADLPIDNGQHVE